MSYTTVLWGGPPASRRLRESRAGVQNREAHDLPGAGADDDIVLGDVGVIRGLRFTERDIKDIAFGVVVEFDFLFQDFFCHKIPLASSRSNREMKNAVIINPSPFSSRSTTAMCFGRLGAASHQASVICTPYRPGTNVVWILDGPLDRLEIVGAVAEL